jgi:DNA-binding MarR family transcriptional regulator
LSKNRELKPIELRLVAELMKNSHRSDRDLAKALKISQPTVTRLRNRLKKEGVIREYTVIPDFSKLGYEILGITLVLSKPLEREEIEKAREVLLKDEKEKDFEFIMMERGIGAGFDGVDISFQEYLRWLRKLDFLEVERTQFFLVDLMEKSHYRPFTFSAIAKHIEKRARKLKL